MAKSLISRFLILSAPMVRSSSENAKQKVSHDSWSDWLKLFVSQSFSQTFFLKKSNFRFTCGNKFETYPSVRIYVHSSSLSCWVTNPCSSRSFWICEFNSGSSMRESFHSSRRRFKINFNCWAIFLIRGPLVCWRLWRYWKIKIIGGVRSRLTHRLIDPLGEGLVDKSVSKVKLSGPNKDVNESLSNSGNSASWW